MPGVGGPGDEVRAGSRVLAVFENPLNTRILRAHADGPQRLGGLQERVGWSAQTTVRAALAGLIEIGALEKRVVASAPYAVATELTDAGEEMLFVADVLDVWLARCPEGPIAPDSEGAKVAVKALAGGWGSALMRALVGGTFTLTELHSLMPHLSYPALERRISWMRSTGQIQPVEKEGRGTPYVVTDWLRRSTAPLSAAGRCERRHMGSQGSSITTIEVETAFLLAMPLGPLPSDAGGHCMLAVKTDPPHKDSDDSRLAGVMVEVASGRLVSAKSELAGVTPTTWAVGVADIWLDAVIDGHFEDLRIGGANPQLAVDLINGIHYALFIDR